MMTTREEAAESIHATIGGDYVYYHDDATGDDYQNDVEDLDLLAQYLDSEDPAIRFDAYSHWCAATSGEVVRHMRQWEIDDLEFRQCPEDGGQIVDVTYAIDEQWLYRHTHDRSDGEEYIICTRINYQSHEYDLLFEPQNGILPAIKGEDYVIVVD